ncbi:GNAT family N-acetyltransferase [Bowmanella denitrificans]|uniref:GNAT family N-acetyltransferase n=1 Tax=Bowmanella denitrificans TaxID=366582 RepID=A0ABN0WVB2_9ALTE
MQIKPYSYPITGTLMKLLLEADPDSKAVDAYLKDARVFVASQQAEPVGIAVLQTSEDRAELKNIAVCQHHRGQGLAKQLIVTVKQAASQLGYSSLHVGTGNSSLSQLALYQKCGFRMECIRKDFFSTYPQPIYENGIRCLDLVMLRAPL